MSAAVELSAQHEADAEAGADRQEDEVVDAARDALPLLAQRSEVDVVLEGDREAEPRLEFAAKLAALEIREVRQMDLPRSRVDHAGHADHRAVDQVPVEPRC